MNKTVIKLCATAMLAGLLAACAASTDPAEAYRGESQQEIYKKGKEAMQDRNYSEAIKRFEALDVQYPMGPQTENAQFYLIYAYYMKEEYALASSEAERFIRMYPVYPYVDYAYFMRGMSDYYQSLGIIERFFSVDLATRDLTQIRKAYYDFSELTTRFPNSTYTPAAHQYMIYLRDILADHELRVAEYYYQRKAYVAAVNRASDLIAHYQGAPAVVDGMILLVKAYHQLGMTRNEQEAFTVLKYNYPNAVVDMNS